ncbi:hypothetical protein ABZX98_07345 [Streptomyces sp. NPDC002992]|uniref:hypothetical protein n=1 Tax=Streptomyces sp. NPDC002992 TaxID=3154273 RepID=UPI0033AD26FD
MPTSPSSFWTPPAEDTGCTPEEYAQLEQLVAQASTNGREFREGRFAVGDWLVEKFGPPSNHGPRKRVEAQLESLSERLGLSPTTLRKCRLLAHRWRPEQRDPILASPVYVSFTVMYQVALSSEQGVFDREVFETRVGVLREVMAEASKRNRQEVTEPDYLKAVRKALPPSRRPGAASERKAVVTTVHQFEARQPEVRAAVLEAVRSDTDAARSIAASYFMQRPALARAVIREDPDLAELAAQEASQRRQAGQGPEVDPAQEMLHELVQILGGGQPNEDLLLAEWRADFTRAIDRFSNFVTSWYPADVVTSRADEDVVQLVSYLADEVATWAKTITDSRKPGLRLVGSTTA